MLLFIPVLLLAGFVEAQPMSEEKLDLDLLNDNIVELTESNSEDRIINGWKTPLSRFPHQVIVNNACGGTLISVRDVLSAAHCFDASLGRRRWFPFWPFRHCYREGVPATVRLGAGTSADIQIRGISKVNCNYKSRADLGKGHDIAVVNMERPATLGTYIQTALINSQTNELNRAYYTSGYGIIGWHSNGVRRFPGVQLYYTVLKVDALITSGLELLANDPLDKVPPVKAICKGDSGGPLGNVRGTKFVVVGVTSYFKAGNGGLVQCGGIGPGGGTGLDMGSRFTRVSRHVKWIQDHSEETVSVY